MSRALVSLASVAFQAREPERFGLLYSLVWRSHAGEKLLEDADDPDLLLARRMALAVRADAHRMRTNLRFLPVDDGARFLGWYAPAHFVLEANAQLIARRFPDLAFSIVTPDGAAHWDGSALLFGSRPAPCGGRRGACSLVGPPWRGVAGAGGGGDVRAGSRGPG